MSVLLERCPELGEALERGKTASISLPHAEALFETVRRQRPEVAIEVGMAFGVSTLAILTALRELGGRLVSIDPSQSSVWKGAGLEAVARAGLAEHHELIEDYDYNALPRLLASGTRCELAYIDGWHTFDHAFLDWWYVDKMLSVGGVVGMNDCGWPAVNKVIRFLLGHREYSEMDVGLPRSPVRSAFRWRKRRQSQDRYFRKDAEWEPRWDFYAPF